MGPILGVGDILLVLGGAALCGAGLMERSRGLSVLPVGASQGKRDVLSELTSLVVCPLPGK